MRLHINNTLQRCTREVVGRGSRIALAARGSSSDGLKRRLCWWPTLFSTSNARYTLNKQ